MELEYIVNCETGETTVVDDTGVVLEVIPNPNYNPAPISDAQVTI